jgi:tripartite-type tricarboxylate transporter receptor subunit TctC
MMIAVLGASGARAVLLLLAVLMAVIGPAKAQSYPTRPVTLIVPWPAGGSTDRHLRVLAETTSRHLGQPIVIENKPGGSGTVGGATMAATAKPDGYTLAQLPITIFRLPHMTKVSYNPAKDFTFVIHVTGYTFATIVQADSPWKTWTDFIAHAKANPGKVSYGSPGTGSTLHITMEQIALQNGIKFIHVPFKGEGEMTPALLGGHVMALAAGTGSSQLVEAGQLRYLVFWTRDRVKRFADVPTLLEVGEKIVSNSPYGIGGPKGMDPKIVKILHDAFKKGMDEPAHIKVLEELDQEYIYMNSADYAAAALRTIEEQGQLIERLGLKAN